MDVCFQVFGTLNAFYRAPQMEPDKVIEKLVAYLLDHKPDDPVSFFHRCYIDL